MSLLDRSNNNVTGGGGPRSICVTLSLFLAAGCLATDESIDIEDEEIADAEVLDELDGLDETVESDESGIDAPSDSAGPGALEGVSEAFEVEDDRLIRTSRGPGYLTAGSASCTPGRTVKVEFSKIAVCRTDDDPGRQEEWRSSFEAGIVGWYFDYAAASHYHKPPDRMNLPIPEPNRSDSCWRTYPRRTSFINLVPPDFDRVWLRHGGYENDKWPNGDDPIPELVSVVDFDNCAGNFLAVEDCGWSSDYRRYACTNTKFWTY